MLNFSQPIKRTALFETFKKTPVRDIFGPSTLWEGNIYFNCEDFIKNDHGFFNTKDELMASLQAMHQRIRELPTSTFKQDPKSHELHITKQGLNRWFNDFKGYFFEEETASIGQLHIAQMVEVFIHLMVLRIGQAIKDNEIKINHPFISNSQAAESFRSVENYYGQEHNPIRFNRKSATLGFKASEKFMVSHRADATRNTGRSLNEAIQLKSNSLYILLTEMLQAQILVNYNIQTYLTSRYNTTDSQTTSSVIYKKLRTNLMPGQFDSTAYFDLIHVLKTDHGFQFPSQKGRVLDPCAGWGNRLISVIAHPDIVHYTGVDSNIDLLETYNNMYNFYNIISKSKISAHFVAKPIQDVNHEDLLNMRYNLIFTSPPYKLGIERYPHGPKRHYKHKDEWNSLLHGLYNTSQVLDENGFIVFNVTSFKRGSEIHDLPNEFKQHIESQGRFLGIQYLSTLDVVNYKGKMNEKFVVAKRYPSMIMPRQINHLIDMSQATKSRTSLNPSPAPANVENHGVEQPSIPPQSLTQSRNALLYSTFKYNASPTTGAFSGTKRLSTQSDFEGPGLKIRRMQISNQPNRQALSNHYENINSLVLEIQSKLSTKKYPIPKNLTEYVKILYKHFHMAPQHIRAAACSSFPNNLKYVIDSLNDWYKPLIELGYSPRELSSIAARSAGYKTIGRLADLTSSLIEQGYSVRQIARLANKNGGAITLETVYVYHDMLIEDRNHEQIVEHFKSRSAKKKLNELYPSDDSDQEMPDPMDIVEEKEPRSYPSPK